MPMQIENCDDDKKKTEDTTQCCEYLFKSKDDMRRAMKKLCYGDLYVVGNLWIAAMKTVLVGAEMGIVPTVKAASPAKMGIVPTVKAASPKDKEETPTRPPKMKFTDLCYYKTPHFDYKQYEDNKTKCSGYDDKIIHKIVKPYITDARKTTVAAAKKVQSVVCATGKDVCEKIDCKKKEFIDFMRHPDNYDLRRGVVLAAAITGFIIGRRMSRFRDSVHKGVILGGLSALAAGTLCFPKETDENFRAFLYETSKLGLRLVNIFCWSNFAFREKIPCESDLPPEPKPRKDQCKKETK